MESKENKSSCETSMYYIEVSCLRSARSVRYPLSWVVCGFAKHLQFLTRARQHNTMRRHDSQKALRNVAEDCLNQTPSAKCTSFKIVYLSVVLNDAMHCRWTRLLPHVHRHAFSDLTNSTKRASLSLHGVQKRISFFLCFLFLMSLRPNCLQPCMTSQPSQV